MPNRLSKGRVLVGQIDFASGGRATQVFVATIARTDTAPKVLFTLPAGAVIAAVHVQGAAVSNAGTSATISVGKSGGSGTEYVNAYDVKGATGSGFQSPTAANLGTVGNAAQTVTGTYAETGTPSTSGGPWTVYIAVYPPI